MQRWTMRTAASPLFPCVILRPQRPLFWFPHLRLQAYGPCRTPLRPPHLRGLFPHRPLTADYRWRHSRFPTIFRQFRRPLFRSLRSRLRCPSLVRSPVLRSVQTPSSCLLRIATARMEMRVEAGRACERSILFRTLKSFVMTTAIEEAKRSSSTADLMAGATGHGGHTGVQAVIEIGVFARNGRLCSP